MIRENVDFSSEPAEPFELVAVPTDPDPYPCPRDWLPRIMIDVSHDGHVIPEAFLHDAAGDPFDVALFRTELEQERDWGAKQVAARVVAKLGLGGYYNINIARVLLDFGRFPGLTKRDKGHIRRFAINYPFSKLLSWEQMRRLLEDYYDAISSAIDQVVRDRLIKIAIHTYDTFNPSGTPRPPVSMVTRSFNYQREGRMPFGIFDELCPDSLGEFTCDRLLRDRISLTLEKSNIPCAHNYPYLLPEGAIEVRSQVWFFFNYLRRRFEAIHADTKGNRAYERVWEMLTDTNLRSPDSEALRSYLHMFRRVPEGQEEELRAARHAYEHIRRFLERDRSTIVEEYRFSTDRQSSVAIEVRKDLVFHFDSSGRPIGPNRAGIERMGDALARAISIYLTRDRVEMKHSSGHQWGNGLGEERPEGASALDPWSAEDL